jgi:hypothetical protein
MSAEDIYNTFQLKYGKLDDTNQGRLKAFADALRLGDTLKCGDFKICFDTNDYFYSISGSPFKKLDNLTPRQTVHMLLETGRWKIVESDFKSELRSLLNKHGLDSRCGKSDAVLADLVDMFLKGNLKC